ncbi:MAG: SWIM zinc finger family protein [Verrucomicrobiota bacterium]
MSRFFYKPYVSVAQRKVQGHKKIQALVKKGRVIEPLGELLHRSKIATSFWGHAWCKHLESFSDYENRLPRGRTYVRNGSVLHLAIAPGTVSALVQGSELYEETIHITPLPAHKWKSIQARCQGKIGSLIELLQGKISDEIMAIVTDPNEGLFPKPKEIKLNCSCPDWATMCKHVAAVLYGVGARLDFQPELLFKLRGVDHNDLISAATASTLGGSTQPSGRRRTLDAANLGDVFGIDLEGAATTPPKAKAKLTKAVTNKSAAKKAATHKPAGKESVTKKAVTQKAVAKKVVAKERVAKKAATKKAATKKAVAKKAVAKKAAARRRGF